MIRWEPELLARVVADEIERRARAGDDGPFERYRDAADALYTLPPEERAPAFFQLDLETASALDADAPLCAEIARAGLGAVAFVLAPAAAARDEGADLVPGAAEPTACVRLRAAQFAHPRALATFFRHELGHVADLVDPAFGYDGDRRVGDTPSAEALVRERYRALWCAAVDARIEAAGAEPLRPTGAHVAALAAALGVSREEADRAHGRLRARRPTHADLLARAAAGRSNRCPVCRMSARDVAPAHDLPDSALASLGTELPAWTPDEGLCGRCREVYLTLEGAA